MYRRARYDYTPLPLDGGVITGPTAPKHVQAMQTAMARTADYKGIKKARRAVAAAAAAPIPDDEEVLSWSERNKIFNSWANANKDWLDAAGDDVFDLLQKNYWDCPPVPSGFRTWWADVKRLKLEHTQGDRPQLDAERQYEAERLRHWRLSPCPPRDGW